MQLILEDVLFGKLDRGLNNGYDYSLGLLIISTRLRSSPLIKKVAFVLIFCFNKKTQSKKNLYGRIWHNMVESGKYTQLLLAWTVHRLPLQRTRLCRLASAYLGV